MQLLQVPAKEGYIWFQQGLQLFRRNPIAILMLVLLYILFIQFVLLIPIVGVLAVLLITPNISLSFANACHKITENQPVKPSIFFQGYQSSTPKVTQRLLGLGVLYTCAILLISLITASVTDLGELVSIIVQQQPLTQHTVQQLYGAVLFGGFLYLPIAMLMWFAPLLTSLTNTSIIQALFFSWLACWRNRAAFFLYLTIWIIVLIGLPMLLEIFLIKIGKEYIINLVITPYSIIMLAILYCSFYASWKSCFYEQKS